MTGKGPTCPCPDDSPKLGFRLDEIRLATVTPI